MKLKKYVGIAVLVFTGFFILRTILKDIDQFISSVNSLRIEYLLVSIVCYFLYFYFRALSWGRVVTGLGGKLSTKDSIELWFLSEATRYIPGKIWSFIARVQMAKEKELKSRLVLASMGLEVVFALTAACLLSFQITYKSFQSLGIPVLAFFYGGLLLTLTILVIPILRRKFFTYLTAIRNTKSNYKELGVAILLQLLAWISFGLAVFIIALNISPGLNPILVISIAAFAWLVGYLSIIVPTGIGIREGVLVVLLSQIMVPAYAVMVALLSRFLIVLVECGNVLFWLYRKEKINWQIVRVFFQENWSYILLGIFIFVYATTFSTLSILRHNAFASSFDLANMSQTVWNTLHGRIFLLSGATETVSRFSIHADLILALLTPFYLIWDKARMLLILQSVFLALGAIPVYLLSQKILNEHSSSANKKIISLILVLIYFLNPGMQWTNIYDFHAVALAIPLLLSAFYTAYIKRWVWFWLFILLALTTKEEISLYVCMLGLAIFFVFKEKRIGIATFLLGITWFFIMFFLLIPYFSSSGEHWALNWLRTTDSAGQTTFVSYDAESLIYKFFFAGDVRGYYLDLLKPFSLIPLVGFPWLILSLPELAINVLSSQAQMRSIRFHYDSGITPSLVIAMIFGLSYIYRFLKFIKPTGKFSDIGLFLLALAMLFVSLRVDYANGPLPLKLSEGRSVYKVSEEDRQFDRLLLTIPQGAKITSSSEIRAHLTQRENSFNLPNATESAEYIAILNESRIVGDYQPKAFETKLIQVLSISSDHELLFQSGKFYLFKRKALANE